MILRPAALQGGRASTNGLTLGVLSTSFGGGYFGGLLGSIAAGLSAHGGRLLAVQTLDAGTFKLDVTEPPAYPHHVAWDHMSGLIVLLNAVSSEYLNAARRHGLPVVMISESLAGFECPVIVPDNVGGTRAGIEHLIGHGHRRIAFAGFLGQRDVRERFETYRQTLLDHGLSADPDLFFDTGDMQQTGGERAARAMLAAGLPSTGVLAANDDNAMGLMHALTAAGLRLPADQAIIGFDDTEDTAHLSPRLTSVRQPLEEIGEAAVRMVTRMLSGEEVENRFYQVGMSLAVRESCGCSDVGAPRAATTTFPALAAFSTATDLTGPSPGEGEPPDDFELADRMRAVLGSGLPESLRRRQWSEVGEAATAVIRSFKIVLDDSAPADNPELGRTLAAVSRLIGTKENVLEMMRLLRKYAGHRQSQEEKLDNADVRARLEVCLDRFLVMLVRAQYLVQVDQMKSITNSLNTQYAVSMELLRSQERDPRSLGWLQVTDIRGGCLGLWPSHGTVGERSRLDVVALFDRERERTERLTESHTLESFPPREVVAMADLAADDMVFVVPLKVGSGDWGMLALVGPVQAGARTGREILNQWAALLSVALEHEAIVKTMREQEEYLRRAALFDELTGLPNRAYFRDQLTAALARTGRRPSYRYAVLMLDLDGFKLVNDSLGHPSGDELLKQVAQRISADLRASDIAARFGGDEFALLLEDIISAETAIAVAERLQATLSEPYQLNDAEVVISASIGIAMGEKDYVDTETIIRDADAAMYVAKTAGKRCHALFHPSMHASVVNRLQIEGELRKALENDELQLYYQPIIDLRTGLSSGAEALIRWQHATRGLLAPGAFLPVAEETGLILGIGDWVLNRACSQLKDWGLGAPGSSAFMMSINVSNRQFWNSDLIEDVDQRLTSWGLDPSCLAIEITEGVIMHDAKLASSMLSRLNQLGVQVHIDDFGTGYSSLESLHDLSIDALKIDRSFVSRMTTSPRSMELVRTIVTMGLNLGLDVIAEGIETPEELALVKSLGCTHGQGYLFSKPVPAELAATFVDASARGQAATTLLGPG